MWPQLKTSYEREQQNQSSTQALPIVEKENKDLTFKDKEDKKTYKEDKESILSDIS
jgi:hypothetical protein